MAYKDPEKRRAREKEYREANKEKVKERNRAYYEANKEKNKEKKKAQGKAYYEANKEKVNERRKAYYKANKEKELAKNKAWYYENRDAALLWQKEWARSNPEKKRVSQHNRRDRLSTGRISSERIQHLLKIQKNRCCYCGAKFTGIGYHADHIIPLALGGPNTDDNIQLLCPTCNLKKGAKDPIQYRQSQGFLL